MYIDILSSNSMGMPDMHELMTVEQHRTIHQFASIFTTDNEEAVL